MNKGILLIILLTTATLVISGCATGPGSSKPQQSGIFSSALTGGKSGAVGIECYNDEDCGTTTVYDYCDGDSACTEVTYNVCKNPGTYDSFCVSGGYGDCVECPNGCDDGRCKYIIPEEMTYMDPTSCEVKFIYNSSYGNTDSVGIYCDEHSKFVGKVTHVECNDPNDLSKVVYTGWYENTLPYDIGYTCVDPDYGWYAPYLLIGYCCEIKNAPLVRGEKHTTTINEDGTYTIT